MNVLRYFAAITAILATVPAYGQITSFKHIVVVVQENRTPDNLFYELCNQPPAVCSPDNIANEYDIQYPGHWDNKGSYVTPNPVDLATLWDIEHHHSDWATMCDQPDLNSPCIMDGAAGELCNPLHAACPVQGQQNYPPAFNYVQRYTGGADILGPYITLALTYGWANQMFETNQGPSFPAHQFIYGATSAPLVNANENDDSSGIYAAENAGGCVADPHSRNGNVPLIVLGQENGSTTFPCFTHQTLGTALFGSPKPWKYYTPHDADDPNLWTAPEAIESECGGSNWQGGYPVCQGDEFGNGMNSNVIADPRQVLVDIQGCHLQSLSWVIPNGRYSDHSGITSDKGPAWVASIVNSIGTSQCNDSGVPYWGDTAIIITWDDWGGWYDHVTPPLNTTQYYQLGFRVPLLVVSAYGPNNTGNSPRTCNPYIDSQDKLDFGSVADFIERNFRGQSSEGLLGFADQRALQRGNQFPDLWNFFDLTQPACKFVPIVTQYNASDFITDQSSVLPPDDD